MEGAAATSFYVAAGSVVLVGLLEGITPCAHSWPVVVPFAVGAHRVQRAMSAAGAFFMGKVLAAPLVGALLGGSHSLLPSYVEPAVELATAVVVFAFAGVLLVWPDIFHLHRHCEAEHPGGEETPHDHGPSHEDDPEHPQGGEHFHEAPGLRWGAYGVMFAVGAGTMLVPGSVWLMAARMARTSHSAWQGAVLFELHAVASGLVVLGIAYTVAKFAWAVRGLGNEKVESMLVRISSGVVIAAMVAHMALGGDHAEHANVSDPPAAHGQAEPAEPAEPDAPHPDGH